MNPPITRRQREVLDFLSQRAAFSRDQARGVYGWDDATADKLARRGVLNKRFTDRGTVYCGYVLRLRVTSARSSSIGPRLTSCSPVGCRSLCCDRRRLRPMRTQPSRCFWDPGGLALHRVEQRDIFTHG